MKRSVAQPLLFSTSRVLSPCALPTVSASRFSALYARRLVSYRPFPTSQRKRARSDAFARIDDTDISFFEEILPEGGVISDPDTLDGMNTDWLSRWKGGAQLALKPQTTEQVSKVLKYCNERRLAVVPQGGNTGLVGGSIPVFDEIILSLSAMSSVIAFDDVSGILSCESGCY